MFANAREQWTPIWQYNFRGFVALLSPNASQFLQWACQGGQTSSRRPTIDIPTLQGQIFRSQSLRGWLMRNTWITVNPRGGIRASVTPELMFSHLPFISAMKSTTIHTWCHKVLITTTLTWGPRV